jgi:hypothetical protein
MKCKIWRQRLVVGVLIVACGAACSANISVGGPNQPCSPIARFENRYGAIAVQQAGPGGKLAWGVYPKVPASQYVVDVLVNGQRVDHKDQNYEPHGSINPKQLSTGALVSIVGHAQGPNGVLNFGLLCRSA